MVRRTPPDSESSPEPRRRRQSTFGEHLEAQKKVQKPAAVAPVPPPTLSMAAGRVMRSSMMKARRWSWKRGSFRGLLCLYQNALIAYNVFYSILFLLYYNIYIYIYYIIYISLLRLFLLAFLSLARHASLPAPRKPYTTWCAPRCRASCASLRPGPLRCRSCASTRNSVRRPIGGVPCGTSRRFVALMSPSHLTPTASLLLEVTSNSGV